MVVEVESLPCPAVNPGITFAPPKPTTQPAPDPYTAPGTYLGDTLATYHPYSPGGLVVSSLYCADAFLGGWGWGAVGLGGMGWSSKWD